MLEINEEMLFKMAYNKYKEMNIELEKFLFMVPTNIKGLKNAIFSIAPNETQDILLYKNKLYICSENSKKRSELFFLFKDYGMNIKKLIMTLPVCGFEYYGNLIENEIPYILICKDKIIFLAKAEFPELKNIKNKKERMSIPYLNESDWPMKIYENFIFSEANFYYYEADKNNYFRKCGMAKANVDKKKILANIYNIDLKINGCLVYTNKYINKSIKLKQKKDLFIYTDPLCLPDPFSLPNYGQ